MAARKPRPDLKSLKEASILEAAAAVFGERGLRGARIADIAARAGIGKSTVYEYFRSKEELFLRLFRWYTDRGLASMTAALEAAPGSPLLRLQRACDSMLLSCREMMEIYPLTMEFWSASTAPEYRDSLTEAFRTLYARFRTGIADLVRAGIDAGEIAPHVEPETFAGALIGAVDGIFLQGWFEPEFDPVASGRHLMQLLAVGIVADGGRPETEDPS